MKRFEFSLQKVLDLREFEENTAKLELGRAISESDRIKSELADVAGKRLETAKSRKNFTDIIYLQSIENYINRLDLKKEELLEELAQAELIIEQKRALFAEAMKKRKVIDNLKEKKAADFRKNSIKAEDSIIDEMNSSMRH